MPVLRCRQAGDQSAQLGDQGSGRESDEEGSTDPQAQAADRALAGAALDSGGRELKVSHAFSSARSALDRSKRSSRSFGTWGGARAGAVVSVMPGLEGVRAQDEVRAAGTDLQRLQAVPRLSGMGPLLGRRDAPGSASCSGDERASSWSMGGAEGLAGRRRREVGGRRLRRGGRRAGAGRAASWPAGEGQGASARARGRAGAGDGFEGVAGTGSELAVTVSLALLLPVLRVGSPRRGDRQIAMADAPETHESPSPAAGALSRIRSDKAAVLLQGGRGDDSRRRMQIALGQTDGGEEGEQEGADARAAWRDCPRVETTGEERDCAAAGPGRHAGVEGRAAGVLGGGGGVCKRGALRHFGRRVLREPEVQAALAEEDEPAAQSEEAGSASVQRAESVAEDTSGTHSVAGRISSGQLLRDLKAGRRVAAGWASGANDRCGKRCSRRMSTNEASL